MTDQQADPRLERVVEAGRSRGIDVRPRLFPEGTRTSEDAARAIGCEVAQIAKTLVFEAGGRPVIFIMSGANRVDAKLAFEACGAEVKRADPDTVKAATAFSIGATPPFGHPEQLDIYFDKDLLQHSEVWAACGRPDGVFPADPAALAKAARATVCRLAE